MAKKKMPSNRANRGKQYATYLHTDHIKMEGKEKRITIYYVDNRSTGEVIRLAIHREPCALCSAHLNEAIWPVLRTMDLALKMPEIFKRPAATPPQS